MGRNAWAFPVLILLVTAGLLAGSALIATRDADPVPPRPLAIRAHRAA
jgi:hypothetical protein